MNELFLNSIAFPVRSGVLSRSRDKTSAHSWSIEIECEEAPQLADHLDWPDDRPKDESSWLAGAEPCLDAQMLPLPVESPEELVGQTYSFPQSPNDKPAEWDRGVGWLFFGLYVWEHNLVYPTTVTFPERKEQRYRVQIIGSYPTSERRYDLRVETWLDWVG